MKGRLVFLQIVTILAVFCAGTEDVTAQRIAVDSLVTRGDSLRMAYRFEESLSAYNEALTMLQDTTATVEDSLFSIEISDKVLLSENGRNMVDYVYTPRVLARHTFSIDDFFLYYPFGDSTWHPVPNQLDSSADHRFVRASYIRSQDSRIYWSAEDSEGIRNIYTSSLKR